MKSNKFNLKNPIILTIVLMTMIFAASTAQAETYVLADLMNATSFYQNGTRVIDDSTGLSALTTAEIDQLENIGANTISNTQWGYLGAADQGTATTDSPTFTGATLTGNLNFNAGTESISNVKSIVGRSSGELILDAATGQNVLIRTPNSGGTNTNRIRVLGGVDTSTIQITNSDLDVSGNLDVSGTGTFAGLTSTSNILIPLFSGIGFDFTGGNPDYGMSIPYDNTNGSVSFRSNSAGFSPMFSWVDSSDDSIDMSLDDGNLIVSGTGTFAGVLTAKSADAGQNTGNVIVQSTDTAAQNKGGSVSFGGAYTGTTLTEWAKINGKKESATDGNFAGYLSFETRANGGLNTEAIRIDSSQNVGIGTNSPSAKLDVVGDTELNGNLDVSGDVILANTTKTRQTMTSLLGIADKTAEWDNTNSDPALTVAGDIEEYIKNVRVVTLSDDGVVNSVLADYNNQTISGTTDGTDGQVMVEFPKLYYKEYVDGSGHLEKIEISSFQLPGFKLHEAFSWGNGRDKIYIGAFEAGHDGTALTSVSGVATRTSRTLAQFRTEAIARKSGATQNDSNWHPMGFWQQNLIDLLFYAYYESRDSQTELPGYTEASSYSDSYKRNTGRSINLTTHSGSVDADLGGTDSDLSGILSSGDKIANRFLWIENIFGHIWKLNDGVVYVPTSGVGVSGWTGDFQAVYTTPDPRLWSSTDADIESNYDKLDVTPYAISSDSYIKKVGRGFVPTDGGASSSTYWTDNYWSYLTDVSRAYLRSVLSGGALYDGGRAGVGSRYSYNGLGISYSNGGSRLCYSQI